MKLIKKIDLYHKYYPDDDDVNKIKMNKHISLTDLAFELGISYQQLWRKINKKDYPNNAFSEREINLIQELCKIKFVIH